MYNNEWSIPHVLSSKFPSLGEEIKTNLIPIYINEDQAVWNDADYDVLTFKEAFNFIKPDGQCTHWGRIIWSNNIPPSKSFLIWRLIHNKMPKDENLRLRDYVTISMCSLCGESEETSKHLLLQCEFANQIWLWLKGVLNCFIDLSSIVNMMSIRDRNWSSQLKDVSLAATINVVWVIWF